MNKTLNNTNNANQASDFSLTSIIKSAKGILIVGHINPDGDCFGSGLALKYTIEKLGKKADFVCDSPLSPAYSFMRGYDTVNKRALTDYDTVFALDCGDEFRLGQYLSVLKKAPVSVNIDHHFSNNNFAKINIVEKHAPSACSIMGNILINEGLIDSVSANLIFVGLSTDTGHFFHNNTNRGVFELAATLLDYGADSFFVVRNLYKSNTLEKTRLIAKAINNLTTYEKGKVALITLSVSDLTDCGCTISETEGLIDYAINLKTAEVAACVTESSKNSYKVSFRSKSISVLPAAEIFGGGGHIHAAGCMVFGKREDVAEKVKNALIYALEISQNHNI